MKWHDSLYWRIAVGFVACLALLLLVQGVLFVWVVARAGPAIPNQPPGRFAQAVALDVSQALALDAALDIDAYVRTEYARDAQPFFVVLTDGRVTSVGGTFPDGMVANARARLDRFARGESPARPEPFARPRPFGRGGRPGGFRPEPPALIVSNGRVVAMVVVPQGPPFAFLLSRYAPTLALVAGLTLIVGAALAATVVFGPARRRLKAVEEAARRLGGGDLTARAPAHGRDEVAAVAAAFNAMADDLSTRAQALAESDRARRQLLADVSHELTTPVTAMRGYLETLRMPELQLDEPSRTRYLAIIADETGRLERIIGDLLELARLEGGGGALVMEDVPVAQVFARITERHERALAEAHVTIRADVAPDAAIVHGDRDRLEQALQNLAANALRHAPSGSVLTLGARREGARLVLSVTDEGAGIAPEHLPHLFDRFYKADPSRAVRHGATAAGGSGLGLSIVKAIAERHGGTVTVRSVPGRTVFALEIGH